MILAKGCKVLKKHVFLWMSLLFIVCSMAACSSDNDGDNNAQDTQGDVSGGDTESATNDNSTDNAGEVPEDQEAFYNEAGELDPGEIEKAIFSALVAASEDFSVQNNGVDIEEDGVRSRLLVNLENDTDDPEEMKKIAAEQSEHIAEQLSELSIIDRVELEWQFDYSPVFNRFKMEREGDQIKVTENNVDEETLDHYLEVE